MHNETQLWNTILTGRITEKVKLLVTCKEEIGKGERSHGPRTGKRKERDRKVERMFSEYTFVCIHLLVLDEYFTTA